MKCRKTEQEYFLRERKNKESALAGKKALLAVLENPNKKSYTLGKKRANTIKEKKITGKSYFNQIKLSDWKESWLIERH